MENANIETSAAIEARAIFTTNAAALFQAAAYMAGKIAPKRSTIPIEAAVKIEARPDGLLTLTATDCELFASIELQADVQSPGAFCTNAKNFAAMLGKARKGREFVTLDDSGERPVMKAGRVRFNMKREALADFPCHPIRGTESPLSAEYELSAAQFVADIGAAAKCMGTEERRPYLHGVAIQRRELAGRDRLVIVGCDGSNLAIASRAAPDGLGEWESEIVPARAALAIIAGAKLAGEADAVTVSRLQTERRGLWASFTLGNLTIEAKLSNSEYPDWAKVAGTAAAETSQQSPALFPELLPAYPAAALEKIGKGAPGAITWAAGETSLVGTLADDADMMFVAMMGGGGAPKGYDYDWSDAKACKYLHGLVASRGLPDADELNRRAAAINDAWGEYCGSPLYSNREIQHGKAGEANTSLAYVGGRIVGLTIEASETRFERCETVKDWETLSEREITTPRQIVPVEGSYSVLMPDNGPQREAAVSLEIEGDRAYPVATRSGGNIHLSAAQVRAACGDSVFEVMEIPAADGGKRYVSAWLYRDGATRLLCVGKDGRCPGANDRREYLTREQVDAALAGDTGAIDAVEPIGETEPAAPIVEIAAAVPKRGETSPGPLWLGEPWAYVLKECARSSVTRFDLQNGVYSMIADERAGNYRTRIPAKWQATAKNLFDAATRAMLRGETKWNWGAIPYYGPPAPQEPIAPAMTPETPEIDAQGPEIAEAGQDMPNAGVLDAFAARLAAVEALLATLPGELRADPVATPSGGIERAKRTPAHERAIRRAWAERAARRAAESLSDGRYETMMNALGEVNRQRGRIAELEGAMLNACNNQRDSSGLIMRLENERDAMAAQLLRTNTKRRANALLARKRRAQTVEVAALFMVKLDEAAAEIESLKLSPTYFDADTGAERIDLAGRNAVIAQGARERAEMLERALVGANQRCEQMERALGTGAAMIEKMGTELANTRAQLRAQAAA